MCNLAINFVSFSFDGTGSMFIFKEMSPKYPRWSNHHLSVVLSRKMVVFVVVSSWQLSHAFLDIALSCFSVWTMKSCAPRIEIDCVILPALSRTFPVWTVRWSYGCEGCSECYYSFLHLLIGHLKFRCPPRLSRKCQDKYQSREGNTQCFSIMKNLTCSIINENCTSWKCLGDPEEMCFENPWI